jgi:hypothetical protein
MGKSWIPRIPGVTVRSSIGAVGHQRPPGPKQKHELTAFPPVLFQSTNLVSVENEMHLPLAARVANFVATR